MKSKSFFITFLWLFLFLWLNTPVKASYQEINKQKLFGPLSSGAQYSPWIMHQPGWGSYLVYYCKNSIVNGVSTDRVWRIENFEGGANSSWINDQVVIQGTINSPDDLSCSPGIAIDQAGLWHMYYVTANRSAPMDLYLYHATAPFPGTSWTKKGRINISGLSQPTHLPGYFETPSPIFLNGKLYLYFIGTSGALFKTESTDGQNFSNLKQLSAPKPASHGRVTYVNGKYYYVYSKSPNNDFAPPKIIYLSISNDGENFPEGTELFRANGTGWDGTFVWSPHLFVDNQELRVYYAGNSLSNYNNWPENSSMGLRIFNMKTNISDLRQLLVSFTDIFAYNRLVGSFGQPSP